MSATSSFVCFDSIFVRLTCNAGRRLEVWGSRQGHRGHSEGVHLSWGLHRGCVLCWWCEVNLIIVKMVLKLLQRQKKREWVKTEQQDAHLQTLSNTIHPNSVFIRCGLRGRRWRRWSWYKSGYLPVGTLTLKLISLSLQQVTQFTNNTTKATSAVSDTTRDR